MGSRKLDDLDPTFRLHVESFLALLVEAGIPVMIVDVLRTPDEQLDNIKKGVSWTANSKHLPQEPSGKSKAIDICPYSIYDLHGPDKLQWDSSDPIWLRIGAIGESCRLAWGGRWKVKDMGHFESY